MFKTGGGTGLSTDPWYLLLAVPELTHNTATAPTVTSVGGVFAQVGATVSAGFLLQTTPNGTSIYDITGLTGDSSMNATNLFCDGANNTPPCATSNEISAFGSLPLDFEIFKYTFTPAFNSGTAYSFTTSPMVGGTYLAASGGSNPFSTPFTVTGLVKGPTIPTPEPGTLLSLSLGLVLFAIVQFRRRGLRISTPARL
jgi:hypothetical protein